MDWIRNQSLNHELRDLYVWDMSYDGGVIGEKIADSWQAAFSVLI